MMRLTDRVRRHRALVLAFAGLFLFAALHFAAPHGDGGGLEHCGVCHVSPHFLLFITTPVQPGIAPLEEAAAAWVELPPARELCWIAFQWRGPPEVFFS